MLFFLGDEKKRQSTIDNIYYPTEVLPDSYRVFYELTNYEQKTGVIILQMKTVKILLADDHPFVREGIKHILHLQKKFIPEIEEAENGEEAISMAVANDYDIIIMDISMPEKDGIEATKAIIRKNKNAKILALSMFDENHYIHGMLNAGVSGYVLKNTGPEELSNAVLAILKGKKYYSSDVSVKLIEPYYDKIIEKKYCAENCLQEKLSKREIQIVKMIAEEKTSSEIAAKLNISKRTVEGHRQKIMDKLNAKNIAGIIKYAIAKQLI